tara:strand:- start:5592 stop:6857 length:1266 start_codon:yes stop_codon:yes gene_type:complete
MSIRKKFYINKILRLFIIILFIANALFSQEKNFRLKIQSNPTDQDYWWLKNNNFGIDYDDFHFQGIWKLKKNQATYSINIIGQDDQKKIYFNESFFKYNFSRNTFLRLGKYYKDFSKYMNDELSSGHMLISNNAQPMPKIGFVTSKKFKKFDKLTFDAGIAHGVFKKNEYYSDAPFLHEKFIYLNVIKNNFHSFSIGLVHEAIWAGTTTELGSSNNPGNQPDSFKDFLKVFISADGKLLEGEPHANALGSHAGIWDFNYIKKHDSKELKLYYQHYFEDTSSLRFANKTDGLWGMELKNYAPDTTILFEYLDTSNAWQDPPYQQDYYYWNYQYRGGWSYEDNIIGNPFVNPFKLGKVMHLGLKGKFFSNYYKLKAARRINTTDYIKYKIIIGKKINDRFDINMYLVNSEYNKNSGLGFSSSF